MDFMRPVVRYCLAASVMLLTNLQAQDTTHVLLGEFEPGWEQQWIERKVIRVATTYEVVSEDDSNQVLMGTSEKSASGLWRMLAVRPGRKAVLSWRWKVKDSLSKKTAERTKRGDDYAARVYVVFEPHFLSMKARAISYVWSANQPVGTEFKSPYSETISLFVLQSGDENKGEWMTEERDLLADYTEAFGKPPEFITAVAVMVDTDNSSQRAVSWFDDIALTVSVPHQGARPASRPDTGGNPNE